MAHLQQLQRHRLQIINAVAVHDAPPDLLVLKFMSKLIAVHRIKAALLLQ